MSKQQALLVYLGALIAVVVLISGSLSEAQDYDDEGYGNQGENNQGDSDNYNGGYNGNDDGYSGNMPNYQQNVDSEGSNNQPSSYQPQNVGGGSADADGDYEGDDGSAAAAAASSLSPALARVRRSADQSSQVPLQVAASEPKLRVKRHGKYYIGPVYTYVKTDKHANFKWGVKHKVGKKHHG